MALLCVPVSELVSFAFSTIPIIMSLFNSKNFSFTCLYSFFASSILHVSYMYIHDQHQHLYLSVPKNTSKELLRLLINSGALLRKKINACCRMRLGHDIISGICSLVGKGLTYNLGTCLHYL